MSRKYKMANPAGMYFVSFAVVYWMDVFVREEYMSIIADSLNYCSTEKGLELSGYCLMPSHIHMVFRDKNKEPSKLLKEFKTHTSKAIRKSIEVNGQENKKEWMLWMMKRAAEKKHINTLNNTRNNDNIKHNKKLLWRQDGKAKS
jgi:putative transposase